MLRELYPHERARSVFTIDYRRVADLGFKAVMFDIDATLVPHGRPSTPEVDALIASIRAIGLRTLLLSNNSTERVTEFCRNMDTLWVADAAKPSADGFQRALDTLGLHADEVLYVGDQLFTDVRGANAMGIPCVLVDFLPQPGETHYGKKRMVESWILKLYGLSRLQHRLGGIELEP